MQTPPTHTATHTSRRRVLSVCAHHSPILCVDVKQGGREIGRSSLVAGKWGDLFFGSFPVKFLGTKTLKISIYIQAMSYIK